MTKPSNIEALLRTKQVLLIEGFLPAKKKQTRFIKLLLHIVFFTCLLSLLFMNTLTAVRSSDMVLLHQTACILIPAVNLIAKCLAILRHATAFLSLLKDLESNIFSNHSKKQNEYVETVDKVTRFMLGLYALTSTLFVTITTVSPMVVNFRLLIPAPFKMGEYKFFYELSLLVMASYLAVNSVCFDLLYICLIGLCIAQLDILQDRLSHVLKEAYGNSGSISVVDFYFKEAQILRQCIIQHEMINEFVKKLSVILSFPLFMQYTFGCFVICITILQMTIVGETSTANIVSSTCYSCVVFSQLAIYHWLGSEIIFKSGKITEACYLSQWYHLQVKSQKTLTLLMERSKRPLVLELYKFVPISLESLGVIIRWSYSLLALIKARYK